MDTIICGNGDCDLQASDLSPTVGDQGGSTCQAEEGRTMSQVYSLGRLHEEVPWQTQE